MPYTAAMTKAAVDGMAAAGTFISLHTADPGTTGANEVTGGTYARVATAWGAANNGVRQGTAVNINVPAGTTVSYYGIWSALTAGTFLGGFLLPAADTFGNAGVETVTPALSAS